MTTEESLENKEQEKPQIEAVIFDLDGLLIDSEPVWGEAYLKFTSIKGLPDDPAVSRQFRGMGIREIIGIWKKEYGLEGDVDELASEYRSTLYNLLLEPGRLKLMDGAEELLKKLKGKYYLAIATSGHRDEMAKKLLGLLNIEAYFDQVISGDDVAHGKPAPDVYLISAERLDLRPVNCLVLEDSINGVLSAKAAQAEVFGVNPDEKTREQLDKAGADRVFASLREVTL